MILVLFPFFGFFIQECRLFITVALDLVCSHRMLAYSNLGSHKQTNAPKKVSYNHIHVS